MFYVLCYCKSQEGISQLKRICLARQIQEHYFIYSMTTETHTNRPWTLSKERVNHREFSLLLDNLKFEGQQTDSNTFFKRFNYKYFIQ